MLIEILNDVLFIGNRLREIDSDYRIFYNNKKDKFEVHNIGQVGDSYCLTVPFQYLDGRTVEIVRKTRIENRKKILEEIDKNNEKIEKENQKNILNNAKDQLLELLKYSKN